MADIFYNRIFFSFIKNTAFGLRRNLKIIAAGVDGCTFFPPSCSLRVDHRQAAPATGDRSETHSLLLLCGASLSRCTRASGHLKSLCFSIFHPIAQISHASACLLSRASSCNVPWRWCVSPVHARSDINRPWLAAKASQEGRRVNKVVRVQSLHFSFIHTLHM